MTFMNGVRSLANLSSNRSKFEKQIATEKWTSSLASVERANSLLRQADLASAETEWATAESMARAGVEQLHLSISELPKNLPYDEDLRDEWDENVCLEEALRIRFLPTGAQSLSAVHLLRDQIRLESPKQQVYNLYVSLTC